MDDEPKEDDEKFDLRKHLESSGFTEYDKVVTTLNSKAMTMKGLIQSDTAEIDDILEECNVTAVQKEKFHKAIKLLTKKKKKAHKRSKSRMHKQFTHLISLSSRLIN